jgi:Cu+-exporting ATPase
LTCVNAAHESITKLSSSPRRRAVNPRTLLRATGTGLLAMLALLGVYTAVLVLLSGRAAADEQFEQYWPFVVALAAGFGLQLGLYVYLRRLVHGPAHGKVVAVSGTTSTAAMVSCCTHYLANLLPIVGTAGLVSLAAQYQVELFWVGLAFNAAGVAYIGSKVVEAARAHAQCAPA